MRIRKDLIPKDKLNEISVRQIHEIVQYLFEPLKVSITDIELPKYVPSMNLDELRNRTFEGRLINISNGKALFEPKQGENDKIEYFDKVLDFQDLLFELKHKQKEAQKVENRTIRKEVFKLFDKLFSDSDIREPQPLKTRVDIFKERLQERGFYNLEKVKELSDRGQNELFEKLTNKMNMAYGIAMFDFLGFCEFLDIENGTKYKTNIFLSKLYNINAKDGTQARHYRNSLIKNKSRYTSYKHKEKVIKDYDNLK